MLMLECSAIVFTTMDSGKPMNQVFQVQAVPAKLVIVSRESALAMWQAEFIRDRLTVLYQKTEISILGMTTQGDQTLDVTLSKIGGKGLFVKELETALEDGRADIAVHSLKDMPCLLYTSPSPRDRTRSRMPSSA